MSLYKPVSTDAVHLSDIHLEVLEDHMSVLSSPAYVSTDTQEQASSTSSAPFPSEPEWG